MIINEAPLKGVLIITPKIFSDQRGYFYESFVAKKFLAYDMPQFVQDNISHSKKNVLRGLHYQKPNAQGKLVSVLLGNVWDVVVDIRQSSPTFGQWFGIYLNDINHIQLYVPPGFAHGFCVLSEEALFQYKCTAYYSSENEQGIIWNDPLLNIAWPLASPILSKKDMSYPLLNQVAEHVLFN